MALNKNILGNYIELREEINSNLEFGLDGVRGVNNLKFLMQTKADLNGRDLSKFQIVYPREFVFNHRTSRNGSKFSIAYNDGDKPVICTEDYVVFRIKEDCEKVILAEWLYMYFNRSEFDRYVITNSWGSSTEFYNWSDICAVKIELPDLSTQQKYVDIYNAMVANQQCYERGLEDLKLTFEGFVEQLKTTERVKPILPYIRERTEVNNPLKCEYLRGVGNTGFISPRQERTFDSLTKCNVFYKNDLVYNPSVLCAGAIALNKEYEMAICTEEYVVFYIENQNELIPEYLFIWLKRKETGRYIDFMSIDSVRNRVYFSDLNMISIPIPDIDTQKYIVDIYNCYYERASINEQLKAKIKNICPILIKGSLEEGK